MAVDCRRGAMLPSIHWSPHFELVSLISAEQTDKSALNCPQIPPPPANQWGKWLVSQEEDDLVPSPRDWDLLLFQHDKQFEVQHQGRENFRRMEKAKGLPCISGIQKIFVNLGAPSLHLSLFLRHWKLSLPW